MSTTVMLTGVLPFVVLVASALAVPVSLLLLRLYLWPTVIAVVLVAAYDPARRWQLFLLQATVSVSAIRHLKSE